MVTSILPAKLRAEKVHVARRKETCSPFFCAPCPFFPYFQLTYAIVPHQLFYPISMSRDLESRIRPIPEPAACGTLSIQLTIYCYESPEPGLSEPRMETPSPLPLFPPLLLRMLLSRTS